MVRRMSLFASGIMCRSIHGMSEPRTPQWLTKLVDSMVAWQHIAIAYGLGWLYMIFYY